MDSGAVAVFLAGLRLYLDEPTKVLPSLGTYHSFGDKGRGKLAVGMAFVLVSVRHILMFCGYSFFETCAV